MPEQVDAALQKFGLAMGPFRMADLAGLDVGMDVRKRRAREFPDQDFADVADCWWPRAATARRTARASIAMSRVARNAMPDPEVAVDHRAVPRAARLHARARSTDTEIIERCIYALVNEGARIVEEGIAQRSSDVDIVYLNGYGFPAFRGGPMFYADQTRAARGGARTAPHGAAAGARPEAWQPAPLLVRLAEQGGS